MSVFPRDVTVGENNLNILGVEVVSLFLVGCLLGSLPKLGIKTETYGKREHGLNFMGRNEVSKLRMRSGVCLGLQNWSFK